MQITRIAFTSERDDDAEYTIAGGSVDVNTLERSDNPIEDLAEGYYGGRYIDAHAPIPKGWQHVSDAEILKMMNYYGTISPVEAIWNECLRYAAQDHIRWSKWRADDWEFLTIIATVYGKENPDDDDEEETELYSNSLGGVESDSDDYAEKHNKRYGLTRESVKITKPVHTTFVEPYITECAIQNAGECRSEAEKDGLDLSNWDTLLAEAIKEGVERTW